MRLGTDSRNLIFYQDLQEPGATVQELIFTFTAGFSFLESEGSTFWFWTDWNAPKGRVVAIDLAGVTRGTALEDLPWQDVIPEAAETLEFAHLVQDQWITGYLKDAASQVKRWSL